ncbi:hypothetical protein GCM10009651_00690 [Microbacterium natoriense]
MRGAADAGTAATVIVPARRQVASTAAERGREGMAHSGSASTGVLDRVWASGIRQMPGELPRRGREVNGG